MADRKKKTDRDLVGIRHKGKALCLNCAGFKRSRAGDKMDRILRREAADGKHTVCELCGEPLI